MKNPRSNNRIRILLRILMEKGLHKVGYPLIGFKFFLKRPGCKEIRNFMSIAKKSKLWWRFVRKEFSNKTAYPLRYSVTRNVYQLRPLVFSLGLNNPLFYSWQSAAFRTRIAKNRITIARIATDRSMNLRADCHRLNLTAATWARNLAIRSPLESGLPRSYSCCGNPRHLTAELGKWPNSSTPHFTLTVPLFVTS
jgi:hypothetical protein